jgi:hypothetical protein
MLAKVKKCAPSGFDGRRFVSATCAKKNTERLRSHRRCRFQPVERRWLQPLAADELARTTERSLLAAAHGGRLATLLRAACALLRSSAYASEFFLPSESRYESTFITLLNWSRNNVLKSPLFS